MQTSAAPRQKKGGSEQEYGEEKVDPSEGTQVPRRRGRASKESIRSRSKRKHKRVSGRKSSPGRSAKSWFRSKSDQT